MSPAASTLDVQNDAEASSEEAPQLAPGGAESYSREAGSRGASAPLVRLIARYGGAVLAVAAATGLRWLLQSYFGTGVAFVTYFPTVALVALFGGGGPGMVATVLSVVVVKLWIGFGTAGEGEVMAMGLFVPSGLIMSMTAEMLRRAREREVASLAQQITERKEAAATLEQRVAEQTRELRLLAEALSCLAEGVVITDDHLEWPGPRIQYVNAAMCRITGYRVDELVGGTPRVLQGGQTDRATLDRMKGELAAGRSFLGELVNYRKDGTPYHAELFVTPLVDACGRSTNFVAIHRDVSERKRAEEALQDREVRLRAILATAVDAIITIDERGIIDSVNPATERLFGFSAGEMLGQNVNMLMPAPYREEHDGYLANYLSTGVKRIIGIGREVQGRRKDGTVFPIELAVSEFFDARRWFTGIIHDLSARKSLEREVVEVAAQEQQHIGRELHDGVGQELTGLGLMADALARRLVGREPADEQLAAKVVRGLARVHEQVRGLCRGLIETELDAEGLRAALATLAVRTSEQSGIACQFQCPEPVPVDDPITAKHLYRIAQEAVSNALRHGRPRHIRLSLRGGPEALRLSVYDDGVGVPEQAAYGRPSVGGNGPGGMGIATMRYRAGLIGGALQIGPSAKGGTLVNCIVPRRIQGARD